MKARIALAGIAVLATFGVEASVAAANYASTVLADNPRHYWRMDDGVGQGMQDSSPDLQKKNGSYIGTSRVSGVLGGSSSFAMRFFGDAQDSRSEVDQAETYNAFTIEFWVRTTDFASGTKTQWWEGRGLVDADSPVGASADFGTSLVHSGKVAVGLGTPDDSLISNRSVNDGAWHHVVAQYNGSEQKIFIDGQLDASETVLPDNPQRGIDGFTIGAIRSGPHVTHGTRRAAADLDEVAIYPNAFPPERVTAHYNAGRAAADNDNDGIPNDSDFCPNARGPANSGGCPDSDGDGLIDANDACPEEAGPTNTSTSNGCPLGTLTVIPAGAGRGNIYGPGLACVDVGLSTGSGNCETTFDDAPRAIDLRAEPQTGSRFNSFEWSILGQSGLVECGAECQALVWSGRTTQMRAIFHREPVPLARAVDGKLGAAKDAIDRGLRDVVNDGKKPPALTTPLSGSDLGTNGQLLVGAEQVKDGRSSVPDSPPSLPQIGNALIGTDASSLIGTDASSLIGLDGSSLIGLDGSSLIGLDGSSLIGTDGSSLVGNNGNSRTGAVSDRAGKRPKPKLKLYALGTAVSRATGSGTVQSALELTEPGRKFLSRFGQANAKRKNPKELPVGLLEIIVPEDGQGGAFAYEPFKIG